MARALDLSPQQGTSEYYLEGYPNQESDIPRELLCHGRRKRAFRLSCMKHHFRPVELIHAACGYSQAQHTFTNTYIMRG